LSPPRIRPWALRQETAGARALVWLTGSAPLRTKELFALAYEQEESIPMRAALNTFWDAIQRFLRDDGWAIASHIALSILMSLFPFLIFVTALGGFLGSKELADEAVRIVFQAWPEQAAAPIAREIHNVLTQARGGLLTIGAVLAVYFSSNGVEAVRVALNRAYGVRDDRPWWRLRAQSILFVLVGALALLTFAFAVVLAPLIWEAAVHFLPHLEPLNRLITFLRLTFASLVLLIALVLGHKFLPAGRRSVPEIVPGILLTFTLWIAAGTAFGAYLSEFASRYVSTYAGLASVMIALVFLYMVASIFIFGGELNAAILRRRHKRARGPNDISF
jgi:membrane protein